MSELFDIFDDVGLTDRATREFLVEALENAEADDWRDILEPFVSPPDKALETLRTVPGVIARSKRALAKEEQRKVDEVPPIADAFLKALVGGVVAASGLHTAARLARVCRAARDTAASSQFWRQRTRRVAALWWPSPPTFPHEAASGTAWRDRYFELLRPRFDGIYVGECGFRRWLRLGHHMDLRKNAEQLAFKSTKGGGGEWVAYRRYIRFLPPQHDGSQWALVLQDPCPREAAERALVTGVDVWTHTNPEKSEGGLSEGATVNACDQQRLRKRICAGQYDFSPESAKINIRYIATDGEYRLTMSLAHGAKGFGKLLTWEQYEMASEAGAGEVITFNLGRLPDWKGGGLEDENKDHFPQMAFRPKIALENLCV